MRLVVRYDGNAAADHARRFGLRGAAALRVVRSDERGDPQLRCGEFERVNPRRNVARTVLATLAISSVIILVPVAAITMGASDVKELTEGNLSAMVTAWSNSAVGTFVSLCVALAIVNAGIVLVTLIDGRSYSRDSLNANPCDLIISLVWSRRGCGGKSGVA